MTKVSNKLNISAIITFSAEIAPKVRDIGVPFVALPLLHKVNLWAIEFAHNFCVDGEY